VPFSRYNLTELKNIDEIVNDKKLILKYLANKIGTNIIINRARTRPNNYRIFIVGIYSSAFLQKLVIKFLKNYKFKLLV
jgi:hypothetical protein